jgi:DDE superfamily endonuclease.
MPEDSRNIPLLDNCNAHSHEFELRSGNISVPYLPPNVMPLIQPVDQGVIQHMKCYYWQDCVRKLVNHEGTVKDFQRTYAIRDAVFSVAFAWNSVKAKTLHQVWRQLQPVIMIAEGA